MLNNNLKGIIGIEEFIKDKKSLGENLASKCFLIRADFNVPIVDGVVVEDLRMRSVLPTVKLLQENGAKIILISHIETKDGSGMEVVAKHFNEKLGLVVKYINEVVGENVKAAVSGLQDGEVLLLQNLRTNEGEKNNDETFARELASLADFYINDAFAVSHRKHASVVSIPKFLPHFAGIQLMKEITSLTEAIDPPHPFVFILGGAKFDTKLPLIKKYLDKADSVVLGGALVNDVYKARGFNIGKSLVSDGSTDISDIINNPKLIIGDDVVAHDAEDLIKVSTKKINEVNDNDVIADAGPSLIEKMKEIVASAKFVLWNGPLGNYENGFTDQTIACAKLLMESGVRGAIGGGDTVAAVKSLGLDDLPDNSTQNALFVSTGGGAMIDFLVNETLPGIEALR
jgi:phosphoglycerate kinase